MLLKVLISSMIIPIVCLAAPQRETPTPNIDAALSRMASPRWIDRSHGFADACRIAMSGKEVPGEREKFTSGLVKLLYVENAAAKVSSEGPRKGDDADQERNDEYEQYYASLIEVVAKLNDERAVPALLAAAPTGGMATRGIARFGDKAVAQVLDQVRDPDPQLAVGAVHVLREMLKMHTVSDPDLHRQIKAGLHFALSRPEFQVRLSAIGAIEYLDDRDEFVPVLTNLAENDPFKLVQPQGRSSADIFVVRRDAARLLVKIEAHEVPATN